MDQKFVDAITNVRLVSGTIRIDLMNITGQTDDNKLQFAKTGELILSQQAFAQALNTMQEVDAEIKKRTAAAGEEKAQDFSIKLLDSDTPSVSIITLLSGRTKFLPLVRACVEAQTYPEEKIEWIVVDDGDEDFGEFFSGSRELYLRTNKPLNIGRKRQFGSDVASGEFIFFFDDDDLHYPHQIYQMA